MDASATTQRRRQKTLFADRIIQQTTVSKGWKRVTVLEGAPPETGAMTYPAFYQMQQGAIETSPEELASYQNSVPNQKSKPSAPRTVTATPGNAQAVVSFLPPLNTGNAPILRYTVLSNPGFLQTTGTTAPITVTGLTNGTSYTFMVFATNSVGNSPQSLPSAAVTPITVPSAPTAVSATAGNAQATISFTAPTSDGGSPILSYTVTSSPDGLTATGSGSPIVLTGLTNGITYTFTVTTTNLAGTSIPSAASSPVTPNPPIDLTAPTLTFALPASDSTYIYFTAGAGTVTNYLYTTDGGATTTALDPADMKSPVLVSGLTNGVSTDIQLQSTDGSDTSPLSNLLTVTPNNTTLPTPRLFYNPNDTNSFNPAGPSPTQVFNVGMETVTGTLNGSVTHITGTGISRSVFDFAGGYISYGQLDFGSAFTVCAWVRPIAKFSLNALITNGPAGANTQGFKFSWNSWQTSNGAFVLENGSPTWTVNTSQENQVTVGTWQHIAFAFDKTNRTVVFLKNGVPVNIVGITTAATVDTNRAFNIGAYTDPSYTMRAELGYIKVYDAALSAYQIAEDFNLNRTEFGL